MDIPKLSTALSQTQLMTQVSTAVLARSLDTAEEAGDSMVKMMEQSVSPNVGRNIDLSV